jgi:hypothetical protein
VSTWRETVWDQPDIPEDLEQLELEVTTTYHATVARTGKRWTATVDNLPDHHVVQIQGVTWREAADNVIDNVSALVGHNSDTAGLRLSVPGMGPTLGYGPVFRSENVRLVEWHEDEEGHDCVTARPDAPPGQVESFDSARTPPG